MDDLTELLLGWVGSLLVALALVVAAALALQAWHPVHHKNRPAMVLDEAPPVGPPVGSAVESTIAPPPAASPAPSTFWSGRG